MKESAGPTFVRYPVTLCTWGIAKFSNCFYYENTIFTLHLYMRVVLETGKKVRIYQVYLLLLISIPCYGNKIMPGK